MFIRERKARLKADYSKAESQEKSECINILANLTDIKIRQRKNNSRLNSMDNFINDFDLVPVSKWNTVYQYPTVSAIRQMIFKNTNNIKKCIKLVGKRYYIKISEFKKWIEETNM